MVESPGSNVRRRHIGRALQRLREDAGKTQKAAGHLLERSPSSISLIENGLQPLRCRDLKHILDMYGVTDQTLRGGLLELARQDHQSGWWQDFADVVSPDALDYASLENDATHLDAFETGFVPGLLQTDDYARSVLQSDLTLGQTNQAERFVAFRKARQRILHLPEPPQLRVVLDEAALRRTRGSSAIMRDQLLHLLQSSDAPNITLQVLPFSCVDDPGVNDSFWMLEIGAPAVLHLVLITHLTGRLHLEDRADIQRYREAFERLRSSALEEADTRELIHGILSDL